MVNHIADLLPAVIHNPPPTPPTPSTHPRTADAVTLLTAISAFDQRYLQRSAEEYDREVKAVASMIGQTNLTIAHLVKGVQRVYMQEKAPYSPIGPIIAEAKNARRIEGAGYTRRAMLPAAPPARGPIKRAYAHTLEHTCPNCGALPEQPCTLPNGAYRKIPCIPRIETANSQQG